MSEPAEVETVKIPTIEGLAADLRWLVANPGRTAVQGSVKLAADRLVEQANQLAELRALVEDLVSEDDCDHDHHLWYCKTHIWFDDGEVCPHQRAKELGLGAVEQYANQPQEVRDV